MATSAQFAFQILAKIFVSLFLVSSFFLVSDLRYSCKND